MQAVEAALDRTFGDVRTDAVDMSFGEIMSLHANNELIIQPEYQRLFRWTETQESKLIESILLGLPIPPVFVIENEDGRFELIDGLQRISSVLHFLDYEILACPGRDAPLKLRGCELVPDLNDLTAVELPLRLRLQIKRASVRMVIIRRQSSPLVRYEMFQRLNTGGALLSPQEIRNCTARMVGDAGVAFYRLLEECAALPCFQKCTATLSEEGREEKGNEELVLRFFAARNWREGFRGSIREWLDNYMRRIIFRDVPFSAEGERIVFERVFTFLADTAGEGAFVRYRGESPIGGLAPAYFEALSVAVAQLLDDLERVRPSGDDVVRVIAAVVQSAEFRENTGPGANTLPKLERRIGLMCEALQGLAQ